MADLKSVFLSSTAKDLRAFRDRVRDTLAELDYHCVRMEDFGARAWEADEFCRARVRECDVFVGLVGHLYGSSPQGREQSYTELEYNAAQSKPRLMFVADDDFPLPARLREADDRWRRQQDFRERVKSEQIVAFFTAAEQLASQVVTALRNLERESATPSPRRSPGPAPAEAFAAVTVLTPSKEVLVDYERFVFIRGGTFPMGADDGYATERPRRPVTVRPFFMQAFPVTNRLFLRFVQETMYVTTAEITANGLCLRDGVWTPTAGADFRHPNGPGSGIAGREDYPVVLVSWYDAHAFCEWFSERTSFEVCLPSENEWEYASSNGKGQRWSFGDAFVEGRANLQGSGTTIVGAFPPNEFGLFDMTGNVYEWCADRFAPSWVEQAPAVAPGSGADTPADFVLRGGSWYDEPKHARCSHRFSAHPALSASNWGFRTTLRLSFTLLEALVRNPGWGISVEEMFHA